MPLNNEQLHHKTKTKTSTHQQQQINKVSLSCFNDIHDNGISSYAYGHYKIE